MDALAEECVVVAQIITSTLVVDSEEAGAALDANRLNLSSYLAGGVSRGDYAVCGTVGLGEIASGLSPERSPEMVAKLDWLLAIGATMKNLVDVTSPDRHVRKAKKVQMSSALKRAEVMLRVVANRCHANLHLRLEVDGEADIDQSRFEQVLMNLYRNAEQAVVSNTEMSRDIFISVHKVTDDDRELFPALRAREYLCVTVKNGGPGMDSLTFARVGSLDFSTQPKGEGGRIGLQVCAYMMEEAGGFLAVKNHEIHGTEFTLFFPVTE